MIFGQEVFDVEALNTGVKVPLQLSFAVTLAGAGTSPIHCTVTSVGHPLNTGLVVSCTRITCVQAEKFPQASVARHTRVMVFGQEPAEVIALNTGVNVPSQLSFAVTAAGAGTLPIHCTVTSVGQPLNTGLVVSCTRMVCVHEFVLPQLSVAR